MTLRDRARKVFERHGALPLVDICTYMSGVPTPSIKSTVSNMIASGELIRENGRYQLLENNNDIFRKLWRIPPGRAIRELDRPINNFHLK